MNKVERCDYLDLLCHQWTDDGLPDNLETLATLLGYRRGGQVPARVLEKFPVCADGKRRNARLEEERQKQIQRIERKRFGAQKTNTKRWGVANGSLCDHLATGERVAIDDGQPQNGASPANARKTPTLEQARAFATEIGVTPDEAESWWHAREASEWTRTSNGVAMKIGSIKSDCKSYVNAVRERAATKQQYANHRQAADRSDKANPPGRYASPPSR